MMLRRLRCIFWIFFANQANISTQILQDVMLLWSYSTRNYLEAKYAVLSSFRAAFSDHETLRSHALNGVDHMQRLHLNSYIPSLFVCPYIVN